jgi:disulfide bond formation protein DsbB
VAPFGAPKLLVALVFLLVLACAAPFLAGAQNILGLIIIGFGVYQAWKINRVHTVVLTGPHAIASPSAAHS